LVESVRVGRCRHPERGGDAVPPAGRAMGVWSAQSSQMPEADLHELLDFLECPQAHQREERTTNAVERALREIRDRTRPMGCFQNGASVDRTVYGIISNSSTPCEAKPLPNSPHLSRHYLKSTAFFEESPALQTVVGCCPIQIQDTGPLESHLLIAFFG
jgi:hypothetical protein